MDKNYNYERSKLILPEYGRHIHEMVDYLMTIKDRDLRNAQAQVVIQVMGNVNPVLRDAADFTHKLWDHLFIISEFKLDVDSPYPLPSPDMFEMKPQKIEYPQGKIKHKQYGRNVENLLSEIKKYDDEQEKAAMTATIARYMRSKYYEYNQEHPNNETISKDIREMSGGMITIDEATLSNLKSDYKQTHQINRSRKSFSQSNLSGAKSGQRNQKQSSKHRQNKGQHK